MWTRQQLGPASTRAVGDPSAPFPHASDARLSEHQAELCAEPGPNVHGVEPMGSGVGRGIGGLRNCVG